MNKLKQNIAIEYSPGLMKVLVCAGETLPLNIDYIFTYAFQNDGVKIFLWPINQFGSVTPCINIKFEGGFGTIYQCKLVIKINKRGEGEFILYPEKIDSIIIKYNFETGDVVKNYMSVELMEKNYHSLYISNNALELYKKLLKNENVRYGLRKVEVQEIKNLTEKLDWSIRENNIREAEKTLKILSEWDFKLSCC